VQRVLTVAERAAGANPVARVSARLETTGSKRILITASKAGKTRRSRCMFSEARDVLRYQA